MTDSRKQRAGKQGIIRMERRAQMIRCRDVLEFLQELAPFELAEEWDNVGLMAGSENKNVNRMLLCLDVTAAAINKAADIQADLIVTHHPLIFKGLKRVTEDDIQGSRIYAAISVISAHTNLDHADTGVNARLASVLGLSDTEVFGRGPGRVGILKKKTSLEAFVCHVRKCLDVPHVAVIGRAPAGVRKVAVFSGSFDDDLCAVKNSGADVTVTGELKYHTALDAREAGMCFIAAGHFHTERVVLPYLAEALAERFPETEVICFEQEADPFIVY
jgi:dinuclear metal center YbgI/SA1388 family protein